jgi:hypothetical protein
MNDGRTQDIYILCPSLYILVAKDESFVEDVRTDTGYIYPVCVHQPYILIYPASVQRFMDIYPDVS